MSNLNLNPVLFSGRKPESRFKTWATIMATVLPLSVQAEMPSDTLTHKAGDQFELTQPKPSQAQCPMRDIEAKVLTTLQEIKAAKKNNKPLPRKKIEEVITTWRAYFLLGRENTRNGKESTIILINAITQEIEEAQKSGTPLTNDEINCRMRVLDLRLLAESPSMRQEIKEYTNSLEGGLK